MKLCYILILLFIGVLRICNAGPQPASFVKKIVVAPSGGGDYTTINDAINNGVPSGNTGWIHIQLKAGVYNEMIGIFSDKSYIFLEGEGADKTTIAYSTFTDLDIAPLYVKATNFVAKGITFKNTYNHEVLPKKNQQKQAPAVSLQSDMISFYDCNFLSVQDTLYDGRGRHYFYNCYIEGFMDFICGNGQSVYENCTLNVVHPNLNYLGGPLGGYITAQRRTSPTDTTGFVFKYCKITSKVAPYLGRAWGAYSRVIFYKSDFQCDIDPAGWYAWNYQGAEQNLEYSEVECTGRGSDTTHRVGWERNLSPRGVKFYTGIRFNNQEHWIQKQPKPLY